jgi:hypothetical protein
MPRKKYSPTHSERESVAAMAGAGFPQEEIALRIRIAGTTLRRYFRRELDSGAVIFDSSVVANLLQFASGKKGKGSEQVRAAIFWLQSRRGWGPPKVAGEGQDEATGELDMSRRGMMKMSDAQLYAIARGGKGK